VRAIEPKEVMWCSFMSRILSSITAFTPGHRRYKTTEFDVAYHHPLDPQSETTQEAGGPAAFSSWRPFTRETGGTRKRLHPVCNIRDSRSDR
jgi:hypothetical protein